MAFNLSEKFTVLIRFFTQENVALVLSFKIEAVRNKFLWCLILESIVSQKMNFPDHTLNVLHFFDRFTVRYFPLVYVIKLTFEVQLVHFINSIESVYAIAEEKQELVGQDKWNVDSFTSMFFFEFTSLLLIPVKVVFYMLKPFFQNIIRDAHVNESKSSMDFVIG